MAPSNVTDSDVLAILKEMNMNLRVRTLRAKFKVGQHVRISKKKMKFRKGADQSFSQEIFRIKEIKRTPRLV
jgi:hypothetical protein